MRLFKGLILVLINSIAGILFMLFIHPFRGNYTIFWLTISLFTLIASIQTAYILLVWFNPFAYLLTSKYIKKTLYQTIDRELSRMFRNSFELNFMILQSKRQFSLNEFNDFLRVSDIVFTLRKHIHIVIMTDTSSEHAQVVAKRIVKRFAVTAVTILDGHRLPKVRPTGTVNARFIHPGALVYSNTDLVLQSLRFGLFRAQTRARRNEEAPIYILTEDDIKMAISGKFRSVIHDFAEKVA